MIPAALARQLRQGLADFLRFSFRSSTPGFTGLIEDFIARPGALDRGPYLSLALPFVQGQDPDFFPDVPLDFVPHAHQEVAWRRLRDRRSTLVATGTGSGKTECFLLPILDHCLRDNRRGVKAIIVYPMNALATDQAGRIARLIHGTPALRGVRAGLYVGGVGDTHRSMGPGHLITDRGALRRDPPDILLTNYKMLDYLLLRPEDQGLWQHNGPDLLRFLVVDELHTFDGAQGTDLACLVRRLKHRLKVDGPAGGPCCVGTSATLGDGGESARLLSYAASIFGEAFDDDAIVGEQRLTAEAFLAGVPLEAQRFDEPEVGDLGRMDPTTTVERDLWVREQAALWFGAEAPPKGPGQAVALGEKLRAHATFRALLEALDGRVRALDELVETLGTARTAWRKDPALGRAAILSLAGLASAARREEALPEAVQARRSGPPRILPLVDVRLQMWQRELRRMVASVGDGEKDSPVPRLVFSDDLDRDQRRQHLPVVHCRDCTSMGWATRIDPDKPHRLATDLGSFYRAFFSGDPRVRFLYPAKAVVEGDPSWRQARRVRVDCEALVVLDPGDEAAVVADMVLRESTRTTDRGTWLSKDCPFCGARDSLALIGFQAATLTSALIDQLFASPFNDEAGKKLLAFSDSVQDSAHRAGFFGTRTWRFNLRVALQQTIAEQARGATLAELPGRFVEDWRRRLGMLRWVSAFLPPNMDWMHEWDEVRESGAVPDGSGLPGLIAQRMGWEVAVEFGLQARIGRSLARTRAAAVEIDPGRLEAAVEALRAALREPFTEFRRKDTVDALRQFVVGLVHAMRLNGAIESPELPRRYIETGGGDMYMFRKTPHLPGYGPRSRLPALLTDAMDTRRFDTWSRRQDRPTWYDRWLVATLYKGKALQRTGYDVYPVALPALVAAGLLRRYDCGAHSAWAVAADALRVTDEVRLARCERCGHEVGVGRREVDPWLALPCLNARCAGHYDIGRQDAPTYFAQLYAHGDLERIFAHEHNGLLERVSREEVERSFKESGSERRPWDHNLLCCTPTLEMGIDIGDLSSTFLCQVPPAQSNYLQRVGRAGRRDGNALVLTMANARPHDLYFFAEPLEMMDGAVEPPGVFLNAGAVLERQLTAFCVDRWVATDCVGGDVAGRLPRKLGGVFAALDTPDGGVFPHGLVQFVRRREPELLRAFVEMFPDAAEHTRAHLRDFLLGDRETGGSLEWRLLALLEKERKQRDALAQQADELEALADALRKTEAKPADWEDQVQALETEKHALRRLKGQINQRQTLEFLTDQGLLPNYAFPESAIRLQSVIFRQRKAPDERGRRYDAWTFDYARAPSAALSEFAPEADFYAGGRHVTIDRVDLASSEVERWRFCPSCNHASVAKPTDPNDCPACGTGWKDPTQERSMLRLTQVFASAGDRGSRIRDDKDEREPRFFQRQTLVDVEAQHLGDAWMVDEPTLPFGFDFLERATFRDVNFGAPGEEGEDTLIAGRMAKRPGFAVCADCGAVRKKARAGREVETRHAIGCPVRRAGAPPAWEDCLYLYRQFESEALRLLLPMTDIAGTRQINSFVAALQLGLKVHFRGQVDHLKTTLYSDPVADSALRRQYLVLFDAVPGGTGYLKQLVTPDADGRLPFFAVLEAALARLKSCPCWNTERDGCYHCLLAYHNARDMADTSAAEAARLIERILEASAKLTKIAALSEVKITGLLDSVLEVRFLEALRQAKWQGKPAKLQKAIIQHRPCYRLRIGEADWDVIPQIEPPKSETCGVKVSIDFVLRPAWPQAKRPPIAVFLDGWEFHHDRIGRDLLQRQALRASGRWDVWTLTWTDLDEVLRDGPVEGPPCVAHPDLPGLRAQLGKQGLAAFKDIAEERIFETLRRELATPDPADLPWPRIGSVVVGSRLVKGAPADWTGMLATCAPAVLRPGLAAKALAGLADKGAVSPFVQLHAALESKERMVVVAYLDDRPEHRTAPGFRLAWNAYWRMFQLLRGLKDVWFFSWSGLDETGWAGLQVADDEQAAAVAWEAVDLVEPEFVTLCRALIEAGVAEPDVGLEVLDGHDRVWAECELVWEARRVAVTDRERAQGARGEVADGWTVFVLEELDDPAALVTRLADEGSA